MVTEAVSSRRRRKSTGWLLCRAIARTSVRYVTDEQESSAVHAVPPTLRDALRVLRPLVGASAADAGARAMPLERLAMRSDPPTVADCTMLEPPGARAISLQDGTTSGVAGFLDGVQRSRVIAHLHGSPIVFASVAAAIRVRRNRRLESWEAPLVRRALYGSRAQLGESEWTTLAAANVPLVDITDGQRPEDVPAHPHALRARALELVGAEREVLERQLATRWCRSESGWLWIDGGISGNLAIDVHTPAFGVVKSHTTMYGTSSDVQAVLALREAERSPVFLIAHRRRRAVASWYLRLRTAPSGDPLHGLVRVELAPPPALLDPQDSAQEAVAAELAPFSARCDRLSAWVLAERAPLSLPDSRWDTLTYGVHACEMYLDAVVGY